MTERKQFSLLRSLLLALGLSEEAVNDVVDWILDLLAGDDPKQDAAIEYPYRLSSALLSAAELSFYTALAQSVADRAAITFKVSLGDLFRVESRDQSKYRSYRNKIDRKHIDFLLCDPKSLQPLLGIELDDSSHQRRDRAERDAFVDRVFEAAGLPLLHIAVRRSYNPAELAALISPYLNSAIKLTPAPVEAARPRCPECGAEMMLRTARRGSNAGNQFWGCSRYPECRGIAAYSE